MFACNFDPTVDEDDGSCEYAQIYFNCDGECINDSDDDGVCDENEFSGCADPMALNYFCEESSACGFDFSTGFPIFILPDGFDDDGSFVFMTVLMTTRMVFQIILYKVVRIKML